ncbi:Salivary plasminogen activator beta [Holothuria leucospilota]|uniref:Salivary plasminogen activator beta n=1 Tax=Holothuria leucospilota TaxID=206669 RepID=A0A9Q1B9Y9_HOLLE|nr:Salivary plasminogen activator beta [Holothuria leucospilota]
MKFTSVMCQIINQDFIQCFILAFREGSIISYFVIDVQARNTLQPQDFEDVMLAGAFGDSQGLILYNRFATRSLTIDGSSIDFVDTSSYGCNRNLICLNGGTCIEDSSVYEYVCRCPPTYTGDRCHIAVQATATTVPPRDEPASTPTALLVVLAAVVLFMVLVLSVCCCWFP